MVTITIVALVKTAVAVAGKVMVTTAKIGKAVVKFYSIRSALSSIQGDVDSVVNFIRQHWADDTADSQIFLQHCERLKADIHALEDCAEQYRAALEETAAGYDEAQRQVVDRASNLQRVR